MCVRSICAVLAYFWPGLLPTLVTRAPIPLLLFPTCAPLQSSWHDPAYGVPAANLSYLLGGEASLWTDRWCYIDQCGASGGGAPIGHALFDPSRDTEFGKSAGGMVWPRGFVAASAFWNFNGSASSSDPAFVAAVWALNDAAAARGGSVCPTNCSSDELSACGVPYIANAAPGVGAGTSTQPCEVPEVPSQQWTMARTSGPITLLANASLCLLETTAGVYPLTLGLCSGPSVTGWTHDAATAHVVSASTGFCMDRRSDGVVGTYECGSGSGLKQPNQEWNVDALSGLMMSLFDGTCLTAQ